MSMSIYSFKKTLTEKRKLIFERVNEVTKYCFVDTLCIVYLLKLVIIIEQELKVQINRKNVTNASEALKRTGT